MVRVTTRSPIFTCFFSLSHTQCCCSQSRVLLSLWSPLSLLLKKPLASPVILWISHCFASYLLLFNLVALWISHCSHRIFLCSLVITRQFVLASIVIVHVHHQWRHFVPCSLLSVCLTLCRLWSLYALPLLVLGYVLPYINHQHSSFFEVIIYIYGCRFSRRKFYIIINL